VTILFADVKGSTAMAETLDPEDVMEIMSGASELLVEPVVRHEGTVARLMGDGLLAFFGAPLSHEDDPQRAVRAALDIMAGAGQYAAQLERERGLSDFSVRAGINTGLVVVGEVGADLRFEYTAMGDAINLAARLEQSAPPGSVLISHDTYRHVRGDFDVAPQEPLAVKGRAQPVITYIVERARPHAFRRGRRGVEGIETPLVGREAELKQVQESLRAVVQGGEFRLLTVVGEAGVGKSRLLDEFALWTEQERQDLVRLEGRVDREMRHQPHALLRSLFSFRFGIRESDAAGVARDKLVQGLASGFRAEAELKAHIVGQLLGLDFNASPHVQAIGKDAQQLRDRALIYLGEYLHALAAEHPLLVLLEDLHWADDSSLDALERLAANLALGADGAAPVLVLCAARPSLYERRPGWGSGRDFYRRLDLSPLTKADSRQLVAEILQRVEQVPPPLRDIVVSGAEGNPFFLEELIKMLIEEGVIRTRETAWSVDAERLGDLHVPPTLTGVLQARLDRLPFDQRQVLQQASVIGRLFWDLAVAYIAAAAETEPGLEEVCLVLAALQRREMVYPEAASAFEGAREYLFKHALLREVTYEGVLKRVRRAYHGLVADWMMTQAGERAGEYVGLLADHLALAGRDEEAAVYLRRAAEQAAAAYANAEAVAYYSRALELMLEDDAEERYTLLLAREKLYQLQGAMKEQGRDLAALKALAGELDGTQEAPAGKSRQAEVAVRRTGYERGTGDTEAALAAVQAAVRLAQAAQDAGCEADARRRWGWLLLEMGDRESAGRQFEGALALAQECGTREVEADCLGGLGWVLWDSALEKEELATVTAFFVQASEVCRETGDRRGESAALHRRGVLSVMLGDLPQARAYYEGALDICREIGDRRNEATPLAALVDVFTAQDDFAGAVDCLEQSLAIQREVGDVPNEAMDQVALGMMLAAQGHYTQGEALCRQALPILREGGVRRAEAWALRELGLIHWALGDYLQARTYLEESLRIGRDIELRTAESESLALLGLVRHVQGDDEAAREHAEAALESGQQTFHMGQGTAALVLGHALAGLGDTARAKAAYREALGRYRQSGYLNPPMEARAGLARVALAQGHASEALDHVEAILHHLQAHTLDGTFEPFRTRLTCYQVLRANEDARAEEVLHTAYRLLQERAARIEDKRLSRSFIENVPAHRELVHEAERASLSGQTTIVNWRET
jgi:class 3 adenylate cyclase/tetratricopeptide (TPR) repeat protein